MPEADAADRGAPPLLASAVVLHVEEDSCTVLRDGSELVVTYAPQFPTPRQERVSPGHRVAIAAAPNDRQVAVWRWYDAVVVRAEGALVRMWEPAHGDVRARPRDPQRSYEPGTRAYLSAGLPGAEWWVGGPASPDDEADVELDEVEKLYTDHDLWNSALA